MKRHFLPDYLYFCLLTTFKLVGILNDFTNGLCSLSLILLANVTPFFIKSTFCLNTLSKYNSKYLIDSTRNEVRKTATTTPMHTLFHF